MPILSVDFQQQVAQQSIWANNCFIVFVYNIKVSDKVLPVQEFLSKRCSFFKTVTNVCIETHPYEVIRAQSNTNPKSGTLTLNIQTLQFLPLTTHLPSAL